MIIKTGIESFYGRHWFGWVRLLGLLAGLGGAVVMLGISDLGKSNSALVGNLCLIGNCTSFALYVIFQRPLFEGSGKIPATRVTFWSYAAGTIYLGFACLYYAHDTAAWELPASGYYALAYATFLSSGAAYLLISWYVVCSYWCVVYWG